MYFSLPVCAQYLGPWGKSYLGYIYDLNLVQLRFAEFGPKLVLCEIVVFGSITILIEFGPKTFFHWDICSKKF